MNLRERKKEPPDLLLPLFDLPITSSFLVDLAMSLLIHRFPFPAIPFPCPFLDFALSSVSMFYQIGSPPQPVVGVQSTTRRFRSWPYSAMIRRNYWVQNLCGCGGLPGSTRPPGSFPSWSKFSGWWSKISDWRPLLSRLVHLFGKLCISLSGLPSADSGMC